MLKQRWKCEADVVSEALKADLNVYPMLPLLSAARGSPFLCDVCHQPAHPPGLLPASSAPLTRTYRHMAFTSSPAMDLYIMDLFQFTHRRIEHVSKVLLVPDTWKNKCKRKPLWPPVLSVGCELGNPRCG